MKHHVVLLGMSAVICWVTPGVPADDVPLFEEKFDGNLDDWWVEGGERVWIEEGRLHVDADPPTRGDGSAATIWLRHPVTGDVRVSYEACVVSSTPDVNNINLFLFYSDPKKKPLAETMDERQQAAYPLYHPLNGYIFTYVNDAARSNAHGPKARIRIRRCPGFELLSEAHEHHCRQGHVYHFEIVRRGKKLSIAVDGQVRLTATDPNPHGEGHLGLRTFRTHLWWDNIQVHRLAER